MDRLIYTALSGLQRTQEAQTVTAHNLANLSTPGFRKELSVLSAGWLVADQLPTSARVQSGGEASMDLLSPGRIEATGRELDVAMDGNAWLSVADAQGQPALTRRGDLMVDANGALVTGAQNPVLGEDGAPIRIPAEFSSLRIGRDGALEILPPGEITWAPAGRIMLQSPAADTLGRGEDGLFRSPDATHDPQATLRTGALERSNLEPALALVELIQQSRMFEMQTKLLTAAREMDESSAALMRIA